MAERPHGPVGSPAGTQGLSPVALARPGSRVLLVGTGRHEDGAALPEIPEVGPTLDELAAVLRDRAGVPDSNLRVLANPATPVEFGNAVKQAAAAATDALLICYAGHGLIGRDDALYLATVATTHPLDDLSYRALPYAALRELTLTCRARTIAVLLDCCYSGRADLPGPATDFDAVFAQTAVRGGFLLSATARDELGLVLPGTGRTAFAGALIGLLRDGDAGGPEYLTLDGAFQYLSRALPEQGAPRPRRQAGDNAGNLILAPNPAYRPPLPVPLPPRGVVLPAAGEAGSEESSRPAPGPAIRGARCPYRGLPPYGPEDARYFFGHAGVVDEVTRLVTGADGGDGSGRRGMIAVVGTSGSGKTSLLRAGVVPALEALPPGWTIATMTPGADPTTALSTRRSALAGRRPAALLVDQFEELFTAGAGEGEQERFVRDLAAAAEGPLTIVIAVRADFYPACLRLPLLAEAMADRQVTVGPLTPEELRTVIEAPARAVGQVLEDGLPETLLREARARRGGTPTAVLPLLSHALFETWRLSGNMLTLAAYRATGGIEGAVAATAERAYASLGEEDQAAARALLLRLVTLGEGTEDTRRRLPLAELTGAAAGTDSAWSGESAVAFRALDALVRARLVSVDDASCEIAHEALLHAWPRLRAWLDEDRRALLDRQYLEDTAHTWDRFGRQDADLYRDTRLETAERAVSEAVGAAADLSPVARDFLATSRRQRAAGLRDAGRRRFRLRAAVSGACALAVAAAAVGGYSVLQHRQATHDADAVYSSELAGAAAAADSADPGEAAQFAAAAYQYAPSEQAASALYGVLGTPIDRVLDIDSSLPSPVLQVSTEPGGPLAAAVAQRSGDTRLLRVYDQANPAAPVTEATLRTGMSAATAFLPGHGAPLLVGSCPAPVSGLCLWSLANPRAPAVITELPLPAGLSLAAGVPSVAVSPDGLLVAAAVVAHGTLLWSVANPGRPRFLTDLPNPSAAPAADSPAVAFASAAPGQGSSSRAGAADLLAETVYDGQTSLWQVSATTGGTKQVAVLGGGFTSIAFGSSGTPAADLLTAAGAAHIGLWNVANPSSPTSLTDTVGAMTEAFGAGAYLTGTAISPDGTELAYVSEGALDTNGQLCVLPVSSVAAGAGAAPSCTSTGFGLTTVAYTASGAILSGGTDDEVRLWRNPVPQATGATGGGDGWGVSPDDRTMTTVDVPAGGTLPTAAQVWDITGQDGPRLDATLPVAASFVSYLSATELLTVTSDGTATAWDLTDPRRPVRGVSFGTIPDGSPSTAGNLIAIQGTDGRLHIWRLADVRHVTQVADIPVPGALPGSALITADGKAALAIAATKEEATATIDWWDLTTPSRATPAGTTPIGNVQGAFAVDDTVAIDSLAAGPLHNQGVIDLFDVVSGRPTRPVAVTDTAGNTVALSGDGRLLAATGSGNNTVHLWDVANPLKPVALGTFPAENQVTELEFDSGDDQLAVLNVAGTLQLWDIASPGAPVLTAALGPQGQNDAQVVIAARYLPAAGQRLLVDTVSGIGIIDADPATLAASLCAYSGNSLTPQVWDTYISHVPYQNPCRDR